MLPPKTRDAPRETLFKRLLILYTLTVASLHWAISARHAPGAASAGLPARLLALRVRVGAGRERSRAVPTYTPVCADRIAAYYAPQWTQPRLEDFEFLLHTSRVWKAAARTSRLLVFTDADARTQLARTCRAHPECLSLSAPPFRQNRTTAAYREFVGVLMRSLLPATHPCGAPAGGILVYAPAVGQRGASLDSRVLLQQTRMNTTTCLDVPMSPCMVFAW
jgi:hypothetical protein